MPLDLAPSPALEPDPALIEAARQVIQSSQQSGRQSGQPGRRSRSSQPPVNKKKAWWTPERRAALSEKMKQIQEEKHQATSQPASQEVVTDADVLVARLDTPTPPISGAPMHSPFMLTDDHEFPTVPSRPPEVDRVDIYSTHPASEPTLIGSVPIAVPPPAPGTPSSPYRRCPCLAVLPGRVCVFCYGTHWMKLCPKCDGEGRVQLNVRKGAERTQPCGHCAGRGTLPANMKEIGEATRLAEEWAAAAVVTATANGQTETIMTEAPEFHRAVKLPGIGVTSTKRGGTLVARRRDRERNEVRKQKRGKQKAVTI
jgi:hypothetical protein